jgi:anti-sigma factor RsiW
VVQLGTDVHHKVQALLPWYVAASLGAEERASIDAHLAECPRCQSELAWERKLQAAADDGDAAGDVDQGFALLRQRIIGGAAPVRPGSLSARLQRGWRRSPAWARWALAAQFAVVATLGISLLLVAPSREERYRTLGAPAAATGVAGGGNLIVRFRPETTEQQMRSVLRDSEARLVYGPTTTDAYLLAVPAGRVKAAVTRLRGNGVVLLVESLDGGTAP